MITKQADEPSIITQDNRPLSNFYYTLTQPDEPLTLAPGSRPVSKFANDPTVSCQHNPYQYKCTPGNTEWNQEDDTQNQQNRVFYGSHHTSPPSCLDFYNQTDGKPLYWQKLRADSFFRPTLDYIVIGNDSRCWNDNAIDFYIHWQTGTTKKYVDLHRGLQLRQRHHAYPNHIKICFTTDENGLPAEYFIGVKTIFNDCLWHYGEIPKNNSNATANQQRGM